MYNKICLLHLTHPSMSLVQSVRSSGQLCRATHLQVWSQAHDQNHLLEDSPIEHVLFSQSNWRVPCVSDALIQILLRGVSMTIKRLLHIPNPSTKGIPHGSLQP